jgi:hypothetical protein
MLVGVNVRSTVAYLLRWRRKICVIGPCRVLHRDSDRIILGFTFSKVVALEIESSLVHPSASNTSPSYDHPRYLGKAIPKSYDELQLKGNERKRPISGVMHCVPKVKSIDSRSIDIRRGGWSGRGGPRVVEDKAGRRLMGGRSLSALVRNDIISSTKVLNISTDYQLYLENEIRSVSVRSFMRFSCWKIDSR